MSETLRAALAIFHKDLRVELRTKDTFISVLVFALIVAFIFAFAFDPSPRIIAVVAPGIVWVSYVFTGILGLNRTFVQERDRATLEGLLLSPVPRESIYLGKLGGAVIVMLAVEAALLPVFLILYDIALFDVWFGLTTAAATVGFAAVGILFSAIAVHTRAREVLLPLLFVPVALPVIIGAVQSTEAVLAGGGWEDVGQWLQLILAFDVVFLVLSSWAFGFVVEE